MDYSWTWYEWHGFILWFSWFVLGFIQVLFGRWFPYATPKTGYIHLIVGVLVLGLTIFAAIKLKIVRGYPTFIDLDV